jgi:hypothetical protein
MNELTLSQTHDVMGGVVFLAPAAYSLAMKVGAIGGVMGTFAFIIDAF